MPAMREQLQALFSDQERNAILAIGESGDLVPDEKVLQAFQTLGDPLLADEDLYQLLGNTTTLSDIQVTLRRLVDAQQLEYSDDTQRPLDDAGVRLYRLVDMPVTRLKIIALEAELPDGTSRYTFTCEGRIIRSLARVQRLDALSSTGQQRAEILSHVRNIATGIRGGIQVPNSLLISLLEDNTIVENDEAIEDTPQSFVVIRSLIDDNFEVRDPQFDTAPVVQQQRLVEINFPFRRAAFDDEKSALLVDGQQRTAALSLVSIDAIPRFEFSVNAVIATADNAKEVFAVANSARPIPIDFKRALVGAMGDESGFLREERLTASVTRHLAVTDEDSPFYSITRYPGLPSDRSQVVVYNTLFSVVKAFEQSALKYDGDVEVLAEYIKRSFNAVKETWPEAWGVRPSFMVRLMGGLGLRAMALLIAWYLERGSSLTERLGNEDWENLRRFLAALRTRVLFSEEEARAATGRAEKFWKEYIKDGQNTAQDISTLFSELKKLVPSLTY